MAAGRFITLEGGEGAGKSTQARRLADALAASGLPVLLTREPGGTPGAEAIRTLLLDGTGFAPLAEAMLHFAARAEHVARVIRPALAAGMWVVCDRYYDSTMAYQGHAGGAGQPAVAALIRLLDCDPHLTLVLDVPVEVSLARLAARGTAPDRYERLGAPFFARIRDAFRAIAAAEARCVLIPAEGGQDAIAAALLAAVRARLG